MLLDTHVWRWYAMGDQKRISRRGRREIDRAARHDALVVSVVSMFELAALSAAGRLHLVPSVDSWIRQSVELGHFHVTDVTSAIAIEAGSIPTTAIPDPVDRFLVATSRTLGIPIATRDAAILEYVTSRRVGRVLDVSK